MAAGHEAFITETTETAPSRQLSQEWLSRIDLSLRECDYFLLLLSPQAAVSEMVIEELQRVKHLSDGGSRDGVTRSPKPVVLPIRVNCLPDLLLNHDLRNYLHDIPQREWESPADTPVLVEAVLNCLNQQEDWEAGGGS